MSSSISPILPADADSSFSVFLHGLRNEFKFPHFTTNALYIQFNAICIEKLPCNRCKQRKNSPRRVLRRTVILFCFFTLSTHWQTSMLPGLDVHNTHSMQWRWIEGNIAFVPTFFTWTEPEAVEEAYFSRHLFRLLCLQWWFSQKVYFFHLAEDECSIVFEFNIAKGSKLSFVCILSCLMCTLYGTVWLVCTSYLRNDNFQLNRHSSNTKVHLMRPVNLNYRPNRPAYSIWRYGKTERKNTQEARQWPHR